MKKYFKFLKTPSNGGVSTPERARIARSMPGEAAAMASLRYGGMSI